MKIETNSLPFALPFHVGCLLCVVAYKHVFVVIKMRAYSIYSWSAYFLWVPVILILWYSANMIAEHRLD